MTNLSSLSTITTTATALNNIVLVTPQANVGYRPQNGFTTNANVSGSYLSSGFLYSAPSLLFHYEGEQSVTLENDITDHYIEDNTAIQDQITQKPDVITTHGFIGELNDVAPYSDTLLQTLKSKLTALSAYTPALTIDAEIAYNIAFQAYQILANIATSAVSLYAQFAGTNREAVIGNQGLVAGSFNNLVQNKQQQMFLQFYGYRQNNTLFTVQTPWAVFQNMAILKLHAVQDAETNMITDFEVTFKRLRLASLVTTSAEAPVQDTPTSQQGQPASQNSATPPVQGNYADDVLGGFG